MIVVGAIQRVASDQTSESVVSAVHLPGDDMKGRIIGREGRNIRAFEQVTGVNVMIDDTPESVLLSCFDPVRRETARITLTELVKDGRIHPARIEEVHERSKSQIEQLCLRAAEDALAEVGISDLHPALVPILGSLRYRTSYGQNVLKHLVESRAHRRADGRRARAGRRPVQARRVPARHRQGADPRGGGLARHRSGPTSPASTASTPTSCTPSRRTTTRSRCAPSRRCWSRPPTPSAAAGPARGGRASRPTCSGWSGWRRSPGPTTGWRRCSRCRRAGSSG